MIDADEELLKELRIIRMLMIARATESMKQSEAIALLANAGLEPRDIAQSLRTTSGTVSVALVRLRKEGKVRKHGRD